MYQLIRNVLFQLDPETAHGLALGAVRHAGSTDLLRTALRTLLGPFPNHPVQAFGLTFPNPIGLAAGYDKDGLGWKGLTCLGFGHIEVGTVTPQPQPGNERPRVFRLVGDGAIVNRMGFPSTGAAAVVRRLDDQRPFGTVLGVNLGKNKSTPLEHAASDYANLVRTFASRADYLAINISSPNTPGLRRLHGRRELTELLATIEEARSEEVQRLNRSVPVLVKLSPDLNDAELDDVLDVVSSSAIDGIIATNTTVSRDQLRSEHASETGGLSGAPLRSRSTDFIRAVHRRLNGVLPIIGVGGIMSPSDALEKLDAGATLVQIYTGLIYYGPFMVRDILSRLVR